MEYLIKASGLVLIFFLFYLLFLKNETFFKSIRSYFLIGLLLILAIPLIEIPVYIEAITSQFNQIGYTEITTRTLTENTINWTEIIITCYLIGVVFFGIKFIIQLASLVSLITKHKLLKKGNYYFIETSKEISPFSFFNIIIYNKSQFSRFELEQIINHEKAHVQQWHSIDTLLAHLLVITLWFNPFVWLYKKAVQQNLEFLADAKALEKTNNEKLYQLTLLKTCGANYCTEITNNFYNSLLKKRIIMLHKNRSENKNQWKYILVLPLLIAFIFTFNTKVIAQEKQILEEVVELNEFIITKSFQKDDFEKLKNKALGKGLEITVNKLKYNKKKELTSIRINAKTDKSSAQYAAAGDEPINPIKIAFDSTNNSISIGTGIDIETESKIQYQIFADDDEHKTKWIQKDGDSTKTIKVEIINSDEKDSDIKWIESKDDTKVYIIKTDKDTKYEIKTDVETDKEIKHEVIIVDEEDSKESNVMVISSDSSEEPLYLLNGKEISSEEMKKMKSDSIDKIKVFKGEKAIEKYGDKAKDGVILITTKK